jgi:predicted nucleic acid-binding protein
MTERIELYVDTNVVLDWLSPERGNPNSRYLLERVRADAALIGVVSTFGLMEAVQNHQDSTFLRSMATRAYTLNEIREATRERDLSPEECRRCYADVYNLVESLGQKAMIRSVDAAEIWTEAVNLLQSSNVSAPDAIHVGVAVASQCDILATADRQLFELLMRRVHGAKGPYPISTLKGNPEAKFRRDFDRLVTRLRARQAKQPKKTVPPEFKRIVSAVESLMGADTDPKRFKERYERRARRSAPKTARRH